MQDRIYRFVRFDLLNASYLCRFSATIAPGLQQEAANGGYKYDEPGMTRAGAKGGQPIKKRQAQTRSRHSSIARLIEKHGSVAQFARDLSTVAKQQVTWAQVNAWKIRGAVSKDMILHVHHLTGAPLAELLRAKTRG